MQWLRDGLELLAPGWVGSLIGLVGIMTAGITYLLTRNRARLAYRYVGGRLIGSSSDGIPADIIVHYRGKKIERLTRSLVVFWNAGERTILADDIVAHDPLRLIFYENSFVLSATILKQSRPVTQCNAEIDIEHPNQVKFKFSFLDANDGAVIEVLHTSDKHQPEIQGTIRGLPKGIQYFGRIAGKMSILEASRLRASPIKIAWIALATGLITTLAGLLVPWENSENCSSLNQTAKFSITIAGCVYIALGIILIFITRRKYPKSLHIDELGK